MGELSSIIGWPIGPYFLGGWIFTSFFLAFLDWWVQVLILVGIFGGPNFSPFSGNLFLSILMGLVGLPLWPLLGPLQIWPFLPLFFLGFLFGPSLQFSESPFGVFFSPWRSQLFWLLNLFAWGSQRFNPFFPLFWSHAGFFGFNSP